MGAFLVKKGVFENDTGYRILDSGRADRIAELCSALTEFLRNLMYQPPESSDQFRTVF